MKNCPECGADLSPEPEENEAVVAREKALQSELEWPLNFGKHRGMTVGAVLDQNPGYLVWAHENVEFFSLSETLLAQAQNGKAIRDEEWRSQRSDRYASETGMAFDDLMFGEY